MRKNNRKSALVTGASKGMGRAIAGALAAQGYDLAICARKREDLEDLADELAKKHPGITVHIQSCDLSSQGEVEELAQWAAHHFPFLDVLVNNAGLYKRFSLLNEDKDVMRESMQVNLFAPHYLSTYFGRIMREAHEGHIFTITSIAARQPVVAAGSYTVTKVALAGLTNVLREELRDYGVKVTEIIPGSTLTSSWEGTEIPQEQFIQAEDVAQAVVASLSMSEGANFDEVVIKTVKNF